MHIEAEEYERSLLGLNAITREAWNAAQNTEDRREKMQALSLAKECYSMKLDLFTNATVVDDAIGLYRLTNLNTTRVFKRLKNKKMSWRSSSSSNKPGVLNQH
ncbi:MAG: hypothetical protein ACJ71R_06985 [Nitrososphaeraceae archaeon]